MKLKLFAIIALVSFGISSCNDDDEAVVLLEDNSITSIASRNSNLSSLVAALKRADLANTLQSSGPFTVFAPTNAAFTAFLQANGYANLEAVPIPALKEILLNHVVSGAAQSTDLTNNMYLKTLAKGSASTTNTLSMHVNTSSGVKLNGVSNVITTTPGSTFNIIATNGVIHVVDAVIGLPTIVTHATANPNFTSLVGALTGAGQPDFVGILSGTGPFTVFAPTNAAFTSLDAELSSTGGIAGVSTGNLTKVLQYHVANGNVLSSSLTNNQVVATLQAPQSFTINLTPARITDVNSRISNIVATDVQCANGVIHVLDKVLLPTF